MKLTRKRIVAILAALAVAALLALAFQPDPLPVEAAQATVGALQVTIDEDGETRARDRFVIAAPVAGRVSRIDLRDGDPVTAGQTLAQIWPLPLSAREREEQSARLAAAEAALREAEQRVSQAKAEYDQAKRERLRVENLVKNNFVSPQAAEQARTAEIIRGEALQAARFRADSAAAEVQVARAALIAAPDAGLAPRPVALRAPSAGRVLRIPERSERVVAAGTTLLTLGDPAKLEVVVDVLSQDAVRIKPGMPMLLEGWGGAQPLRAQVRLVEPFAFTKVSALGVEEQRVNVIGDFIDSPGALGDGYRVEARIVIWSADSLLKVPASALFRQGDAWSVFVIENGRAKRREVEVGQRNPLEAQILKGLSEGEMVVRHPSNQLQDGARVGAR